MSRMNSRQRKLSYGAGILLLLAPIVYLGFPSQQSGDGDSSRLGLLSQKRRQYELGEATLGNVDPSSSAVNLVLLGLRGPAATWLHVQAIEHQERKEWAKLRATVDSIILLQPHYVQIWKFQGWNLAYNVSREWDKVDDRFYWVKEGIKFLQEGTRRNQSVPILFHDVGDFVQNKMGVSDEKKFFREYFEKDPDSRFETAPGVPGPDPAINPNGLDSYLVAHDWFVDANQKDDEDGVVGVRGMTHVFFRQGPSKALINFAGTRAQRGLFDEHVPAWDRAYKSWMDDYGRMDFYGLDDKKYRLNSTEDDLKTLAEENGITVSAQRQLWAQNLDMTNFRQWRDISNLERSEQMLEARKSFFAAREAYNGGRGFDQGDGAGNLQISEAQKYLETAMQKWQELAKANPNLFMDGDYLDECMLLVQYYDAVHQQNNRSLPATFPLKEIWDANVFEQSEAKRTFLIETKARQVQ